MNLVFIGNHSVTSAIDPDNVAAVTAEGLDVRVDFKAPVGNERTCMMFRYGDEEAAKTAAVRFVKDCNAAMS